MRLCVRVIWYNFVYGFHTLELSTGKVHHNNSTSNKNRNARTCFSCFRLGVCDFWGAQLANCARIRQSVRCTILLARKYQIRDLIAGRLGFG